MKVKSLPPAVPGDTNDPRNHPSWQFMDDDLKEFTLMEAGLLPKTTPQPKDPYLRQRQQLAMQLFKARSRRHLTQAAAAQLVGISQPSYARIESAQANPTINTLLKIAAVFRLEINMHPGA